MSSTLMIRKTPKSEFDGWQFKLPVKGLIARKFYDHDGTLGGGMVTVGPEHLGWFEGLLAGASDLDETDRQKLEEIILVLGTGNDTIDMWFEV